MKKAHLSYIFFALLIISISFAHCKKIQENLGQKFIIKAMTDGTWIVDTFTDNNEDITAGFTGYEFQFTEEGKVYAKKTSGDETGTWEGNVNDLTIYSNFPGATEPLIKLNDTWKIINNTTKLVEAKPFNSTRVAYLKLVKKA